MDCIQCAASARDLPNAITRQKPRATEDLSMTLKTPFTVQARAERGLNWGTRYPNFVRLQWRARPGLRYFFFLGEVLLTHARYPMNIHD